MIELQASVNKTVLTISDVPKIASGSKNYVSVRFQFDSEWSSIQPVMVCYRDIKAPFYNEIIGGTAKIPHEVLRDPGPICIGVFGISGSTRITSTVCRIIIQQGAISQNIQQSDPSNDIWSQIMNQYQEIKDLCKNIIATSEEAAKKAQGFADNASYSATVASQQQQMASKHASTASEAATKCEEGVQKALTAAVTAQNAKDAAQSASNTAKSSATSAKAYAERAERATTGIETALSQANAAAQNAQEAKSAAQAASQDATKAADGAEAAKKASLTAQAEVNRGIADAMAAANKAEQAVGNIGSSVQQAQDAAKSASDSARAAALSKQGIETAEASAKESAKQAAASKTAVEQSATQASEAAARAQQSQIASAGSATSAQSSAAEASKQATASEASAVRAENAANEVEQSAQQIAGAIDRLAIHETASGNPVAITDSADWQMEGLRVYGQSEQVTTTGAQLLDPSKCTAGPNAYGLDITMDGYRVTINGTSTHVHTDMSFVIVQYADTSLSGKGYKIKAFNAVGTAIKKIYGLRTTDEKDIAIVIDTSRNTNVNMSFDIMVSETDATAFEPYTGGKPAPSPEYPQEIVSKTVTEISVTGNGNAQTVTLSAPVTLRGVPVTSGGNVTINGQRYMADLITEREGVVGVERWVKWLELPVAEMNNNEKFPGWRKLGFADGVKTQSGSISTHAPIQSIGVNKEYDIVYIYTSSVNLTQGEWKDKYPNDVVFAAVQRETAVFNPLPEPDQQAIRSLRTYHGNTVVTAGAHTEVDYIADPKLYIDGVVGTINDIKSKIIELESKV